MSRGMGSIGQDQIWQHVIAPQTQKEDQQREETAQCVNCAICGKSIPLTRAVKQDDKLICQECHDRLHTSKRAA